MAKDFRSKKRKFIPIPAPYGDKNRYAIYPDYWKKQWGERPLLGYVMADNEYWAKYAAYDAKLLRLNFTFGPRPVKYIPPVETPVAV